MEQIDFLRDQERINYELNPADVIKEEDYEESIDGMSFRNRTSRLAQEK